MRAQDDLDDALLLVAELLVHRGRVLETGRMSDDEARVDVARSMRASNGAV